ncbi:hypothetical protein DNU06_05985 [Putridiphycobacter roseus]|uniref:Outer membrane protein beta-barrel domain-containing protein n=1 Tax=Putridiphycobacter roseus TaxID=2219161 RepID=A0A2W1NGD8_9FLAO|nr:hypothetical protein [Putridiphycobacter roseus]PZE18163.1 hypothetical protein DNU06_05985 [Putridiphycobacter roseus]
MRKRFLLTLLINLSVYSGYSQNIALDINSFYGGWNNELSAYYYGGAGISLLYEHPLKKGALSGGFALRTIDWGNQVTVNVGYNATYLLRDNWRLDGVSTVGLGLALFKYKPLLVWSFGYVPEFTWLRKKKIDYSMGLGIRYSNSPAYKNYGQIYQLLEFPIKIGVKYHLKGKTPASVVP